jgi:hypothetical protein
MDEFMPDLVVLEPGNETILPSRLKVQDWGDHLRITGPGQPRLAHGAVTKLRDHLSAWLGRAEDAHGKQSPAPKVSSRNDSAEYPRKPAPDAPATPAEGTP